MIAHGDADCLVPYGQSEVLHDALIEAGASSTLTIIEGATHGDDLFSSTQTAPNIEFLNKTFGR